MSDNNIDTISYSFKNYIGSAQKDQSKTVSNIYLLDILFA